MTKFKILIAEDDKTISKQLRIFLEKEGFSVTTAINGREALQLFKEEKYNAIISDLKMPEMKGDALFAEIREISPKFPYFLLTGYTDHTSVEILRQMGISGIFEKPLSYRIISQTLKKVLEEKKTINQSH